MYIYIYINIYIYMYILYIYIYIYIKHAVYRVAAHGGFRGVSTHPAPIIFYAKEHFVIL